MRDLWDRPDWSHAAFYDPTVTDHAPALQTHSPEVTLELSDVIPDLVSHRDEVCVVCTVAGVPWARLVARPDQGRVTAQRMRAAITEELGLALCREVVRTACLGRPADPSSSLRERLARLAKQRPVHESAATREHAGAGGSVGRPATSLDGTGSRTCTNALDRGSLRPGGGAGGGPGPTTMMPSVVTDRLPILMYHRVAEEGSEASIRWRVAPWAFADQMRYLRDAGYHSVGLATWRQAIGTRRPLPGRAVAITFDDGYLDFATHAQPILDEHGFTASVYVVVDWVGRTNGWDGVYRAAGSADGLGRDPPARRRRGSNSDHTRARTGRCWPVGGRHDPRRRGSAAPATGASRARSPPVAAIAYPYGDVDGVVARVMERCGYRVGLTCRPGRSSLLDSPLLLPRIEVEGGDDLATFILKLTDTPKITGSGF